jgi:hypothetical protein
MTIRGTGNIMQREWPIANVTWIAQEEDGRMQLALEKKALIQL